MSIDVVHTSTYPFKTKNMPSTQPEIDEKRLEVAKETLRLYGDQIPVQAQKDILEQRVTLGMSPYEASLAAGAYFFKVVADSKVWPPNTDPNIVIANQATQPDDSKIWLTFETPTQFLGDGLVKFTVGFEKGRVVTIEKANSANEKN